MFDIDIWQEIFATIKKNKLRTFLTCFSVFWGIFILVVLLGFGTGFENGVKNAFSEEATNSISIYQGQTSLPYKGMKSGRTIQFTNVDFDQTKNQIKKADHFNSRTDIKGTGILTYKNQYGAFNIDCVQPGNRYLITMDILQGRFIDEMDINNRAKNAAISTSVQNELFKNKNPLGEFVKVSGVPFRVIGVFKLKSDRDNRRVYIPISTGQMVFNGNNNIYNVAFTTGDMTADESLKSEDALRKAFAERHKFDPDDKRALWIENNLVQFVQMLGLFSGIRLFVWFIGILTIIAGIVAVSNIMIIVVKERTKEIGIRKALGATPGSIIGLIIMEALLITGFAGYIGLVAGIGTLAGIDKLLSAPDSFIMNPGVDFKIAVEATLVLVLSGTLAGFIPARRASRIRPIEALRDE